MSKLQIDLGDLGPEFEAKEPHPFDELMARAMEAPNGIGIECENDRAAARKRFQIYKRRRTLQDAGIKVFDKLIVLREGRLLKVMREPEMKVFDL